MIHNGIEYGLMQAYAEGFDILRNAGTDTLPVAQRYDFDLADIAELWRRGSVISSWLLDLAAQALSEDPPLQAYSGFVQDSGEGRWTIMAAIEEECPPMCSRPRFMPASARVSPRVSPTSCSRRCAKSSAAMSSRSDRRVGRPGWQCSPSDPLTHSPSPFPSPQWGEGTHGAVLTLSPRGPSTRAQAGRVRGRAAG